jgi:hypothetical protein
MPAGKTGSPTLESLHCSGAEVNQSYVRDFRIPGSEVKTPMRLFFSSSTDSIPLRRSQRFAKSGVSVAGRDCVGRPSVRAVTFCTVLLSVQLCRATTGVALYEGTFAVVATDGRINEIGPKVMFHSNECKINLINGKVAVVAGLAEEQGVGFDVRKILNSALQRSDSVYEAADMAEQQIVRDLPAAVHDFQKGNPDQFEQRANSSLQILIVGLSGAGEVQIARRSIPYDESRPVQRQDSTGSKDHVGIAAIGETSAIDRELDRLHDSNSWEGMGHRADLENIARRLVALEIVDKPRQVGPPVSVIVVDGDGVHWVNSGACQQHP